MDAGAVPVENSQAGPIAEVMDLVLAHAVVVTGEHYLRVRHCLMAMAGETLESIERVHSHPQALAQCQVFIRQHGYHPVAEDDTARSARNLAKDKRPRCAAIASESAAAIYGLRILASGIETNPTNTTRFWALQNTAAPRTEGRSKTSLTFALPERPGALADAFLAFSSRGLEVTRVETRPRRRNNWEYTFFVDVAGHPDERPVAEAIGALETVADFVRVLGAYPRSS